MLSVVVPCYNESGNIGELFERFLPVVRASPGTEVIFVNNGSTDNSAEVFEKKLLEYPGSGFRVHLVEKNQGYGFGILSGLETASGDVLAWTHADLQTDPSDLVTAYRLYLDAADPALLVKGKRKKRRLAEAFFTFGMELIASAALAAPLNDVNAQPKLFSRAFYEQIRQGAPADFSLDLYFLYMARKNGRILDFPVYFSKRLHGEAKGGGSFKTRIKLIRRTFCYIFDLRAAIRRI